MNRFGARALARFCAFGLWRVEAAPRPGGRARGGPVHGKSGPPNWMRIVTMNLIFHHDGHDGHEEEQRETELALRVHRALRGGRFVVLLLAVHGKRRGGREHVDPPRGGCALRARNGGQKRQQGLKLN